MWRSSNITAFDINSQTVAIKQKERSQEEKECISPDIKHYCVRMKNDTHCVLYLSDDAGAGRFRNDVSNGQRDVNDDAECQSGHSWEVGKATEILICCMPCTHFDRASVHCWSYARTLSHYLFSTPPFLCLSLSLVLSLSLTPAVPPLVPPLSSSFSCLWHIYIFFIYLKMIACLWITVFIYWNCAVLL